MIYFSGHTRFSRWALGEPGFIPQETILSVASEFLRNVCVAEDDSMIILVDDDRVMYELDLERLDFRDGTLTTSMGSNIQNQLYCQRAYQVSSDGLVVVGVYIKCPASSDTATCNHEKERLMSLGFFKTRIELKFINLSGTADQMRKIELEYSDPYPTNSHKHVVIFSPDLSLLQAGLHIFDLMTPRHPQLSFPDSPLSKPWHTSGSYMSFSSCNG